ncbi:MAG: Nramp family divalent metal transporter [Acidobacteria bacterium]|nr:Nramp family divalent metal transporter [Acidobacteriota bacterium]
MKLRHLGPGILLAATSVGASHILMSPEAGARFEYRLVWLVLLVHVLKYPAFEFAPRYVAARGESLLEAYARAPGPRHWALWMGLVDMVLQAVGVLAALIGLTASFLVAAVGRFSLPGWSLLLALALLAALSWGRYASLRAVNLLLMLALALGTLVAFAAAPPPLASLGEMLRPELPAGSIVLVAAILGYMPTSVAVSIWQSLWALEQGRFRPERDEESRTTRLANGLFDLRLGYLLSAVLAVAFVCLGGRLLHPLGLVPEGPQVALTLSRLYTEVLGPWMEPVFLTMAFFALLTTCYTSMDGFPRTFVAALRVLRGEPAAASGAETSRLYWPFLLLATFGGMVLLALVPDPPQVVKGVGAFGLLFSPVYFSLNLWAVTRGLDDDAFRPPKWMIALSLAGIALLVLAGALLIGTFFLPATP